MAELTVCPDHRYLGLVPTFHSLPGVSAGLPFSADSRAGLSAHGFPGIIGDSLNCWASQQPLLLPFLLCGGTWLGSTRSYLKPNTVLLQWGTLEFQHPAGGTQYPLFIPIQLCPGGTQSSSCASQAQNPAVPTALEHLAHPFLTLSECLENSGFSGSKANPF